MESPNRGIFGKQSIIKFGNAIDGKPLPVREYVIGTDVASVEKASATAQVDSTIDLLESGVDKKYLEEATTKVREGFFEGHKNLVMEDAELVNQRIEEIKSFDSGSKEVLLSLKEQLGEKKFKEFVDKVESDRKLLISEGYNF